MARQRTKAPVIGRTVKRAIKPKKTTKPVKREKGMRKPEKQESHSWDGSGEQTVETGFLPAPKICIWTLRKLLVRTGCPGRKQKGNTDSLETTQKSLLVETGED